ncbi:MAG: alpha-D-ribose 1-methylphosphonate 5-triphosphate diphosphatase [Halanaerobiaceae bacterium]
MTVVIKNAKIILEDDILDRGSLLIDNGKIEKIYYNNVDNYYNIDEVYDAGNNYLMAGMIDIHSDAIEQAIEPRPNSQFPYELAISQLERMLVSQGISSIFHSLSFANAEGVRKDRNVKRIVEEIKNRNNSVIRNLVHMRYEITNFENRDMLKEILCSDIIDLFSLMDHSPGQGQYKTLESYSSYVQKTYNLSEDKAESVAKLKIERREKVDRKDLEELLEEALKRNIAVATHDDDDINNIKWAREKGVNIMEFPMDKKAAEFGSQQHMYIAVGAPNIVRGGSHNGNLSAMDLIEDGYANIICSDYYSACMLNSVFMVAERINSLVEAVKMVTLNPARAVGMDDKLGSIDEGKNADFIIFNLDTGYPIIERTYINGTNVYQSNYWKVG